jgi:Ca-activated chloride channel family protein
VLASHARAASLAKTKSPNAPASAPAAAPAEENAVAKIVGRLADAPERTARDWADLGRETAIWGSRLKTGQQPVPEGPVHDALAAATLGAKLDPKATDWPKLREELEALLEKPEEKKPDEKSQDQKKDSQDKQDQDKQDQQQEQQQDPSKQDKSQQDSSQQKQQQQSPDQKQDQSSPQKPDEPRPEGEKAFGDMKDQPPPPPPPPSENQNQQVGGEKQERAPEEADPSLAPALQKLDQIRHQDSPAQLFQMMDGERKPLPPGKRGKDW